MASVLSALSVVGLLSSGNSRVWAFWQILAAAAFVPAGLASALVRGLLLGRQEILISNVVLRRGKYAYTVALLVLWAAGFLSVTTAVVLTTLGQLVGVGVGIRRLRSLGLARPHWSYAVWWELAKRGAIYAAALFAINTNYRIGMVVMERAGYLNDLGQYTVAAQLAEVLWQLPTAFGFVLFAHAASAFGKEAKRVERNVARSTRVSITLVSLGSIILAAISPWVVPLVFGREFATTSQMIWGLLPGIIAFTTFKVINTYFAGSGAPMIALLLMAPTLVVNFMLASVLVNVLGGVGVAYAASISYIVAAIAFVWAFQRRTGLRWTEIVLPRRTDVVELRKSLYERLGSRR